MEGVGLFEKVRVSAVCIGCALAALAVSPSVATAAPSIVHESVSGITETDAILEAQINPQDSSSGALYQFQIVPSGGAFAWTFTCPADRASSLCLQMELQDGALPWGVTSRSTEDQQVTLDLALAGVTLQPGTAYDYRVIAATDVLTPDVIVWAEPIVYGERKTFTTVAVQEPPPEGDSPGDEGPISSSNTVGLQHASPCRRVRHVQRHRHRRAALAPARPARRSPHRHWA
jgi:hypothetical protein